MSVDRQTYRNNGHSRRDGWTDEFADVSAIRLRECCGYLRLPDMAMAELGYAALTFAGVIHFCDGKTYQTWASQSTIANLTGVPIRTAKRHMKLLRRGFVTTRKAHDKKTLTINLTKVARNYLSPFAALPHWFPERRRWPVAFVYSVVLSHLCTIEHVGEEQAGNAYEIIEHRRGISLTQIQERTGLGRRAVCGALSSLTDEHYLRPLPDRDWRRTKLYELLIPPCLSGSVAKSGRARVAPVVGHEWHRW